MLEYLHCTCNHVHFHYVYSCWILYTLTTGQVLWFVVKPALRNFSEDRKLFYLLVQYKLDNRKCEFREWSCHPAEVPNKAPIKVGKPEELLFLFSGQVYRPGHPLSWINLHLPLLDDKAQETDRENMKRTFFSLYKQLPDSRQCGVKWKLNLHVCLSWPSSGFHSFKATVLW